MWRHFVLQFDQLKSQHRCGIGEGVQLVVRFFWFHFVRQAFARDWKSGSGNFKFAVSDAGQVRLDPGNPPSQSPRQPSGNSKDKTKRDSSHDERRPGGSPAFLTPAGLGVED